MQFVQVHYGKQLKIMDSQILTKERQALYHNNPALDQYKRKYKIYLFW